MVKVKCSNCGYVVKKGEFCNYCGTKLEYLPTPHQNTQHQISKRQKMFLFITAVGLILVTMGTVVLLWEFEFLLFIGIIITSLGILFLLSSIWEALPQHELKKRYTGVIIIALIFIVPCGIAGLYLPFFWNFAYMWLFVLLITILLYKFAPKKTEQRGVTASVAPTGAIRHTSISPAIQPTPISTPPQHVAPTPTAQPAPKQIFKQPPSRQKKPLVVVLISLFIWGGGHIYVNKNAKGMTLIFTEIILLSILIVSLSSSSSVLILIAILYWFIVAIWVAYDAYGYVKATI